MKGFIFLMIAFTSITVRAQDSLIKVTDMLRIRTVGNITTSADGSKTAFVVTSIVPDGTSKTDYKYVNHLYMLRENGEIVQLTYGNENASQPAWSPDGTQLAFVRVSEQNPQVFILPMSAGEAWQLTRHPYGASGPKWSPDGKKILFTSNVSMRNLLSDSTLNPDLLLPDWPSERTGFSGNEYLRRSKDKANPDGNINEIRAWLQNNVADRKAVVLNRLNFQDEANISAEQNFSHLYIVPVNREAQPKMLTRGFYRFANGSFTPDGSKIVFSGSMDSLQHPDRVQESRIFIVDSSGRNFRQLLGKKGMTYNIGAVSPAGNFLAYQSSSATGVDIPELAVMSLTANTTPTVIPFDRNKSGITWSPDERHIYFLSQSNGGTILNRAALSTRKVEQLSGFDQGITSYSLSKGRIVYSKTSPYNPSQLFIADENLQNSKEAGNFNAWVKDKKLSLPVKHEFTNSKGMKVEYWVMKPTNFTAGKKYPLLLEIHGGPTAMWGPGEASMWHEFQFFCSKGYGVVYSNPRGSGGYGVNFLRGNIGDWGAGPASDVLGSLDRAVAEGWADNSKLAITGGSYAGYLTAWIIAHDQRFKAACAQRGVYDLATFFGEGNAWRLVPEYFGGYPWEPKVRALLQRESPFTYVDKIKTPFIIFHGDNDRRTGFVQSEMMFRALKVLGRPVEYVRHPNATHEITRTGDNRQRMDQMLRTWEFFERWIGRSL